MGYTPISAFVFPINIPVLGEDTEQLGFQTDLTERKVLTCALGDVLYNTWLQDLDVSDNPQSDKFIDLLNGIPTVNPQDGSYFRELQLEWIDVPLDSEEENVFKVVGAKREGLVTFEGLIKAFPQFIWYDYSAATNTVATGSGRRNQNTENSTRPTSGQLSTLIVPNYSLGVEFFDAALDFIANYLDVTEEVTLVVDNTDNTYTFTVDSTTYLEVGDTVTYNGDDHVVTIVTDTTWTAEFSGPGLSLPLSDSVWHPFVEDDWHPIRKEEINHFGF